MKFNKAQLHMLYAALTDAVAWETSLADSHFNCPPEFSRAKNRALQFANIREQIGRVLRGENVSKTVPSASQDITESSGKPELFRELSADTSST